MDPNATLAAIRELVKQIDNTDRGSANIDLVDLALDLIELVDGLDQWLSKGGFLPSAWHFARR
jgi:hypothetical protein